MSHKGSSIIVEAFHRKFYGITEVPERFELDPYVSEGDIYSPTGRIDNTDKAALCMINGFAEVLEEEYGISLRKYLPKDDVILRNNLIAFASLLQALTAPARHKTSAGLETLETNTGINKEYIEGVLKWVKNPNAAYCLSRTNAAENIRDLTRIFLEKCGSPVPGQWMNDLQISFCLAAYEADYSLSAEDITNISGLNNFDDGGLSFPMVPEEALYILDEHKDNIREGVRLCTCLRMFLPFSEAYETNEEIREEIELCSPFSELAVESMNENYEYFESSIVEYIEDFIRELGYDECNVEDVARIFMMEIDDASLMEEMCQAIAIVGEKIDKSTAERISNLISATGASGLAPHVRVSLIYDALLREAYESNCRIYEYIDSYIKADEVLPEGFTDCLERLLAFRRETSRHNDIVKAISVAEFMFNHHVNLNVIQPAEKWWQIYAADKAFPGVGWNIDIDECSPLASDIYEMALERRQFSSKMQDEQRDILMSMSKHFPIRDDIEIAGVRAYEKARVDKKLLKSTMALLHRVDKSSITAMYSIKIMMDHLKTLNDKKDVFADALEKTRTICKLNNSIVFDNWEKCLQSIARDVNTFNKYKNDLVQFGFDDIQAMQGIDKGEEDIEL